MNDRVSAPVAAQHFVRPYDSAVTQQLEVEEARAIATDLAVQRELNRNGHRHVEGHVVRGFAMCNHDDVAEVELRGPVAESRRIGRTGRTPLTRADERLLLNRERTGREVVAAAEGDRSHGAARLPRADIQIEERRRLLVVHLDGTVTAGNASGANDGAAASLLATESAATA